MIGGLATLLLGVQLGSLPGPPVLARGGPDAFGYTWADIDETSVSIVPPAFTASDLRAQGFTGDETVIKISLPVAEFPTGFPFYGQRYRDLWLSSNGWLSFQDPRGNAHPTPAAVPNANPPNALVAFFWDDWTLDIVAPLAAAGPNTAGDGYTITLRVARARSTTVYAQLYVTLYTSGSIKVLYRQSPEALLGPRTAVGIENQSGATGLPFLSRGVPENGARFRSPYGVQFFPGGSLDCSGATAIACSLPPTRFSNVGGRRNVTRYNCSAGSYDGSERVFSIQVPVLSNLTISVTNTQGRQMYPFLLASCNEYTGCLRGGLTTIDARLVPPGSYLLAVDAVSLTDDGSFDLEVRCEDAAKPLVCGATLAGESTSGPSRIDNWSCWSGLTGPENLYAVDVGAATTLRATLANKSEPLLQVLVASAAGFNPQAPSCVDADPTTATYFGAVPGRYYVAVDASNSASGSYDLALDCNRQLTCPASPPVLDPMSPTPVLGDTTGGTSSVSGYACERSAYRPAGPVGGYTGPEHVYAFSLASASTVAFQFTASNPDLRLLLLKGCDEGQCLVEGSCVEDLPAGNYLLVVDGLNGAAGSYAVRAASLPAQAYRRWTDCPECLNGGCGQEPGATRLKRWSFDSGNYCGTGCDFSLFAVVECGSEIRLPLFDVETGRLRVRDVLRGLDVPLQVRNDALLPACAYQAAGTEVAWQDSGCSAIPCPSATCGGGQDCRTDARVMDVTLAAPGAACGIYRIDFLDWGGFAWDIYANCSGAEVEQYALYPDLCSALSAYRPRPEVGLTAISLDPGSCGAPSVSGTFTAENRGCAAAVAYEVIIEQEPPAPPNPRSYRLTVDAGERVTLPWSYTPGAGAGCLLVHADPRNATGECREERSGAVGCGPDPVADRSLRVCPCGCIGNAVPAPVGNTLYLTRASRDIAMSWTARPASEVSAHRVYRAPDPALGLRSAIADVPSPAASLVDQGAVTGAPQPRAYYQVVGVSCAGDREGPF